MRNSETSNGDTGEQIEPERTEIVLGKPFKDWNEVLNGFPEASERILLLELLEGIVGEEGFFEIWFEGSFEWSWGWEAHTCMVVSFQRSHEDHTAERTESRDWVTGFKYWFCFLVYLGEIYWMDFAFIYRKNGIVENDLYLFY